MKQQIKTCASIIAGNILLAFAICAFAVPNEFMLGGANGIALALQQWLHLPLSVLTAVINSALFLLGWVCMGWKFAAASLLSTIVYPMIVAVFEFLPVDTLFPEDPLICSIFFAVLAGLGIGMVIRVGGSTGGMDIPPCILQKYKGIPVGTSMMAFDMAIVLAQVLISGIDGLLYSILIVAVTSVTVNRTVVTGEQKVEIIIISPAYEEIRQTILTQMDCGATMLNIETGYEETPQKAVFTVVYAKKYPEVRAAVLNVDPRAFIVTSDVKNVNGRGYTLARSSDQA